MKQEVSKPVFFAILAVAALVIFWFGWSKLKTSGGPEDARATVDAAARHMAANGIDIKTVPTWSDLWYKYHPEYKGPRPPVKMPVVNVPGAPGAPGAPIAPGIPGATPGALPGTH